MGSLVMSLLIIESILTAVGVVLYVYRMRLEFKEENTLILTDAEAHFTAGQAEIHVRANQLGSILKYIGIAWLVFGFALLVALFAEGAGFI